MTPTAEFSAVYDAYGAPIDGAPFFQMGVLIDHRPVMRMLVQGDSAGEMRFAPAERILILPMDFSPPIESRLVGQMLVAMDNNQPVAVMGGTLDDVMLACDNLVAFSGGGRA